MLPRIIRAEEGLHQTVLGDEEIVKLTGEDTDRQFLLIEQNSLPGVGIPMHVHRNEDEVFHVVSGQLKLSLDEDSQILSSGDTAFCPRGVPHAWEVVGDTRAKILVMNFPAGLEGMLASLAVLGPDADSEEVSSICSSYGISFV